MNKLNVIAVIAVLCLVSGMQAMEQSGEIECTRVPVVLVTGNPFNGQETEWRLFKCSYKHFVICKKDPKFIYIENGVEKNPFGECKNVGFPVFEKK